uniref:Cysteine and histidine-rich domain-containing protein 1 (Trinotate prediction) n=1 Tax=Henneguya salminicola TaxID=69463 RepID=A0A6G3MG69_HENSL
MENSEPIIEAVTIKKYENDNSPLIALEIESTPELISELSKINIKANHGENGQQQFLSTQPVVGAKCLNNGCTRKFTNSCDQYDICQYHPGGPVFHEGSKYWSCCCRKTGDFDQFVNQPGCETGKHKWNLTDKEVL